ncbi:MAG: hypothetical protein WAV13_04880 [Thermodesulfovibrionales bacterium]
MKSAANRNYTVIIEEDKLIFATPTYRADPDSVLHSGIYNREFSSALSSAAIAGFVYMLVAFNTGNTIVRSLVFLLTFTVGFPFFRKFVFKEGLLEMVFNSAAGEVKIYTSWITKRLKETISIKNIKGISIESRKHEVENPDAVRFVKQISLQHGTVIPGFGEEKVLFLLKLHLSDGSERTIYSDSNMQDVLTAYDEIKVFLKI